MSSMDIESQQQQQPKQHQYLHEIDINNDDESCWIPLVRTDTEESDDSQCKNNRSPYRTNLTTVVHDLANGIPVQKYAIALIRFGREATLLTYHAMVFLASILAYLLYRERTNNTIDTPQNQNNSRSNDSQQKLPLFEKVPVESPMFFSPENNSKRPGASKLELAFLNGNDSEEKSSWEEENDGEWDGGDMDTDDEGLWFDSSGQPHLRKSPTSHWETTPSWVWTNMKNVY